MNKINLRNVSKILSEEELKNVMGGVGPLSFMTTDNEGGGTGEKPCDGKKCGDPCTFVNQNGYTKYGTCEHWPTGECPCVARDYKTKG
jgi:bacteriocin-like protein